MELLSAALACTCSLMAFTLPKVGIQGLQVLPLMHPHAPLLHIAFNVKPELEVDVTKGLTLELVLKLQHHLLHKVRGA
ncbi:unnamed protein product [Closterium sp. NIES-53]